MLSEEKNQLLAIYLVKSAGKIFGPHTEIEIVELIQKQELGALDEIRTPHHRWTYLRDHLQFNEIWRESLKGTRITKSNSATLTLSILQKTQNLEIESSTEEEKLNSGPEENAQASIVRVETPKKETSYNYTKQIETAKNKRKMVVLLFLSLCLLGVAVVTHFSLKGKEIEESYNELIRSTRKFKALELNRKALTYYKQAIQVKEPELELKNQMAFILMSEDHQTFQARVIFEEYLASAKMDRKKTVEIYNGIGLSYLIDDDLKLAEENFLKALTFDADFIPSSINLAYVFLRKENFDDAYKMFSEIKAPAELQGSVLVGELLTLIEGAKNKKENFQGDFFKSRVQKTLTDVVGYQGRYANLSPEIWILKNYLLLISEMNSELQNSIYHWERLNFDISKLFSKELQIDHKFESWDYLEKYCNEMLMKMIKNDATLSLRSMCLIQNQKFDEAKKKIDEAYAMNPTSIHAISANIFYTYALNMDSEFLAITKKDEAKGVFQKAITKIQKCLDNKDVTCVEENLEVLKKFDDSSVFYLNSLAKNSYYKGAFDETLNYLKLSEEKESRYQPNIELKLLIEERKK